MGGLHWESGQWGRFIVLGKGAGTVAALNLPMAPVIGALHSARCCTPQPMPTLTGPVTDLFRHLLRHACATHNHERGMSMVRLALALREAATGAGLPPRSW
ncbi:hypothetical protein OG516_01160 [Streptomyces murinus]|nr:hypothetical protein OG516_01160 [Streptomyces murinus]